MVPYIMVPKDASLHTLGLKPWKQASMQKKQSSTTGMLLPWQQLLLFTLRTRHQNCWAGCDTTRV